MKSPGDDHIILNRLKYEVAQEMGLKGKADYTNESEKNNKK